MFAGGSILSGALDAEADRLGVGIPKLTGWAASRRPRGGTVGRAP